MGHNGKKHAHERVKAFQKSFYHFSEKKLHIYPTEYKKIFSFVLLAIFVSAFYSGGVIVSESLVLSHYSETAVETLLPKIYILTALGLMGFTPLVERFFRTMSLSKVFYLLTSFFFLILVIIRLSFHFVSSWIYALQMILIEMEAIFLIILFFSFVGNYFAIQEARRLYGYIVGGFSMGTMMVGGLLALLTPLSSLKNMIFVPLFFLSLVILTVFFITHQKEILENNIETQQKDKGQKWRHFLKEKYVRYLVAAVLILAVVEVLTLYQMMIGIKEYVPSTEIGAYLGKFYGYIGISELLIQYGLVSFLLRHVALPINLVILPACVLFISIFAVFNPALLILTLGYFIFLALMGTLNDTVDELLYIPLSTQIRTFLTRFSRGIVIPCGEIVAALFAIGVMYFSIHLSILPIFVILLCCVWILLVKVIHGEYKKALYSTLEYFPENMSFEEFMKNKNHANILFETLLKERQIKKIIILLGFYLKHEEMPWPDKLNSLLYEEDELLVRSTINLLSRSKKIDEIEFHQFLEDKRPSVRSASILAMGRQKQVDINELVASVDKTEGIVLSACLIASYRYGGKKGKAFFKTTLNELFQSKPLIAITLLDNVGGEEAIARLRPYLYGKDPVLRKVAIQTAGKFKDVVVLPDLIASIRTDDVIDEVYRALLGLKEIAFNELIRLQKDVSQGILVRSILIRVIGSIHKEEAAVALLEAVSEEENSHLMSLMLEILKQNSEKKKLLFLERNLLFHLEEKITQQVQYCYHYYHLSLPKDPFVAALWKSQMVFYIPCLFALWSIRFDDLRLSSLENNLYYDDLKHRENAIELLPMVVEDISKEILKIIAVIFINLKEQEEGFSFSSSKEIPLDSTMRLLEAFSETKGIYSKTFKKDRVMGQTNFLEIFNTVSALKEISLFKEIEMSYLSLLANYVKKRTYYPEEVLCEQGGQEGKLFLLVSGRVSVKKDDKLVAECSAGDCIGELSFIDREPHSATVTALTTVEVLTLDHYDFQHLLIIEPQVSEALLKVLAARLRKMLEK